MNLCFINIQVAVITILMQTQKKFIFPSAALTVNVFWAAPTLSSSHWLGRHLISENYFYDYQDVLMKYYQYQKPKTF